LAQRASIEEACQLILLKMVREKEEEEEEEVGIYLPPGSRIAT
jgi:hypothetical protein